MRCFSSTGVVLSAVSLAILGAAAVALPAVGAETGGVSASRTRAVPTNVPDYAKLQSVSASSSTDAWAVGFGSAPGVRPSD